MYLGLPDEGTHAIHLTLLGIDATGARVDFAFRATTETHIVSNRARFGVGFFDTPYSDNTMLKDGHRLSVELLNNYAEAETSGTAHLRILEFPGDIVVSG